MIIAVGGFTHIPEKSGMPMDKDTRPFIMEMGPLN
jgi:hypothetical protein